MLNMLPGEDLDAGEDAMNQATRPSGGWTTGG
jgi:hypothetical protein